MTNYRDLAYNAHAMMKEYFTYDDIQAMSLRDLFSLLEYFKPKIQEIIKQQQSAQLKAELTGKKNTMSPLMRRR